MGVIKGTLHKFDTVSEDLPTTSPKQVIVDVYNESAIDPQDLLDIMQGSIKYKNFWNNLTKSPTYTYTFIPKDQDTQGHFEFETTFSNLNLNIVIRSNFCIPCYIINIPCTSSTEIIDLDELTNNQIVLKYGDLNNDGSFNVSDYHQWLDGVKRI